MFFFHKKEYWQPQAPHLQTIQWQTWHSVRVELSKDSLQL